MTPPYKKHVFVCLHDRGAGNPRASCAQRNGEEVLRALKDAARKAGPALENVRINKSGCLDNCDDGCSVVVYPDAVWYGHVSEADAQEIVEKHLVGGAPVERLRLK